MELRDLRLLSAKLGYTGCSKKRIPNFIFGITSVIQHRF